MESKQKIGTSFYKHLKAQVSNYLGVLSILVLMTMTTVVFAQDVNSLQFKNIKDDEGLLSNVINCFLQDRDGFLWIGTYDGLKRYSGSHTTIFRTNRHDKTTISNNVVHKMCEEPSGRIWFSTSNGISYFDKEKNSFFNITEFENTPLSYCFNILLGMDGKLWFSSNVHGLLSYDVARQKIEKIEALSHHVIAKNGMVEDTYNKGIWIATNEGLCFFDYTTKQVQTYRNNSQHLQVLRPHPSSALAIDNHQLIFADNTTNEIVVFDLMQKTVIKSFTLSSKLKKPNLDAATTFVDKKHHYWVATWNYEIFYIDPEKYKITQIFRDKTKPTSIASEFLWGGWEQNEGSIWIGTTNGISILNPDRSFYNVYELADLFPALDEEFGIVSFVEDTSDGSWWLGTSYRGLVHYYPRIHQLTVFKLPNKTPILPYGEATTAVVEDGVNLYMLSGNAIYEFNKKSKTFKQLNDKPIHHDLVKQGENLWTITMDKVGNYNLETKQWKEYSIGNILYNNSHELAFLFVDFQGRLGLITHEKGVYYFNASTNQFELTVKLNDLSFAFFNTFVNSDQMGNLWLYGRDIQKIDLKKHTTETVYESERIGNAVIDDNQNHWLGLYNRYAVLNKELKQIKQFDLPFGVENSKYFTKLFKLRNGHVLSCQKGDIIEFLPEKLFLTSPIGEVLLDKIKFSDSLTLLHHDSTLVLLKENQNTFSIEHGMLNQYDETHYQYFYQLIGNSDNWIATDGLSTTFTNLAGGDYIYRIKAIRADGKNTGIKTLFIHLETVFYKTLWFKVLSILFILIVIGSFLGYRTNQRKKIHHLQIQSSKLAKDKTEIQYQNLINHLNPHFLFNSLTSLNSLIITNPKTASKFLQKLSAMYRYILQSKDKETVTLEQELNFVSNYLELQKARFEEGLVINIAIEEDYLGQGIVPVTLQNLFENAIKHNIIDEEDPLRIEVYVEAEYLIVKNNLQRKSFVETSNKQGLESLKKLYEYLSSKPLETIETETEFMVKIPLL
ncbi:MAG: histidine kinase [Spirosomataceae bacterium]